MAFKIVAVVCLLGAVFGFFVSRKHADSAKHYSQEAARGSFSSSNSSEAAARSEYNRKSQAAAEAGARNWLLGSIGLGAAGIVLIVISRRRATPVTNSPPPAAA